MSASDGAQWFLQLLMPNAPSTFFLNLIYSAVTAIVKIGGWEIWDRVFNPPPRDMQKITTLPLLPLSRCWGWWIRGLKKWYNANRIWQTNPRCPGGSDSWDNTPLPLFESRRASNLNLQNSTDNCVWQSLCVWTVLNWVKDTSYAIGGHP